MMPHMATYLLYLAQKSTWDVPCERFQVAAKELVRRGWARRRRWLFGPVILTQNGAKALSMFFTR